LNANFEIQKKYDDYCKEIKLVRESSLHNKNKDEKIVIMKKLRAKKDEDERILMEQRKKEEEERLEEYYISLKNLENTETEFAENKLAKKSRLRNGFFTTDLVDY
jgi:hypothetical protein